MKPSKKYSEIKLMVRLSRDFSPGDCLQGGGTALSAISGFALLLGAEFLPHLQNDKSWRNMQFHGLAIFP